ncbi:MAG TPA: AbrB/MazE/SpoVT family DNA-binding domain-containing protein [Nevskiales bacterium]|nr:AbrB/MazE/SpoVT family DNA-binding domain-containing protein [Nevskiales bacterium]
MSEATVTSKGQITIPSDVRRSMGLATGERVVFTPMGDGSTVMRAKTKSVLDLKGALGKPRKRLPVEKMNIGRR